MNLCMATTFLVCFAPTLEMTQDFETLVYEAQLQPFSGWDFSYLAGRYLEERPSWDYRSLVLERMKGVKSMLDLGTGGGEFLSSLQPLPKETFATEAYPPNVPIATGRLEPLGIRLLQASSDDGLPFEDRFFELVIDRHESFDAAEVFRILKPGGRFVTQQVGPQNNREISDLFQVSSPYRWTLEIGLAELEDAGFSIIQAKDELHRAAFSDVGALVYYLKAIPWEVPGFSAERNDAQLRSAHTLTRKNGRFEVTNHRCLIEAAKPKQ